jgi:hypothetical protein
MKLQGPRYVPGDKVLLGEGRPVFNGGTLRLEEMRRAPLNGLFSGYRVRIVAEVLEAPDWTGNPLDEQAVKNWTEAVKLEGTICE